MKRIAVLTSGGDSPGMNAAVVALARSAALLDMETLGIRRGYNGLLGRGAGAEAEVCPLAPETLLDMADLPGTYLRTARSRDFHRPERLDEAAAFLGSLNLSALVVIGGDGSLRGALDLARRGIPCVGIPATIDNDLGFTELSLGFDTAVNACVDAVRAIRATSRSHDSHAVVEVMGRDCGDIALYTALSTGAEVVLVPEFPLWRAEDVARRLRRLESRGNTRATVVVGEGAFRAAWPLALPDTPAEEAVSPGPGDARELARALEALTGRRVRPNVVGYVQRGRQPSARDAAFALEAGALAADLVRRGEYNRVIGVRRGLVCHLPMEEALQIRHRFNRRMYNLINAL